MALLQIAEPGESTAPHTHRLAAGIDLGTTNSLVASVRSGLADTLPDVRGMVLCHPGDISEWSLALTSFVQDIAGNAAAQRAPARNRRSRRQRKRGPRAA